MRRKEFDNICEALAELAGLSWPASGQSTALRQEDAGPAPENCDPFFELLGRWDAERNEVVLYQDRCQWAAKRLGLDEATIQRCTLVHFAAHAVLVYGEPQKIDFTYAYWRNGEGDQQGQKAFADESSSHQVTHRHYDKLIRGEELFVQLLSYLYLTESSTSDAAALEAFTRLSQGHCDLYSLKGKYRSVDPRMRTDWAADFDKDRKAAKEKVASLVPKITRSGITKGNTDWDFPE